MAGLAGLLGGYGSEEEDAVHEGSSPQRSSSRSPAAAAASSDVPAGAQQQAPVRLLDGPSTNPEPPPEGLSPPLATHDIDSEMGSEADANGAAGGVLHMLPPELRDPPPGAPHPAIQHNVQDFLAKQRAGVGTVMEHMRRQRAWNNPLFLEKMTSYFRLQQYGSNLAAGVWSPDTIPADDFWPALKQQMAARKRPRPPGADVQFKSAGTAVLGGVQQQQAPAAAAPVSGGGGLPPLPAAAMAAAAAAAAAGSAAGLAGQPGAVGVAPKLVTIDPRAAVAQAQSLAATLAAAANAAAAGGAGGQPVAKKSKWDK